MRLHDFFDSKIEEHIEKVKGGYRLVSKHGHKNLGTYPTRAGAEKRERQVQYFKHAGESVEEAAKPDDNFDVEDIKELEKIRDLNQMKSRAMELISNPSARPMKPAKVAWFRNQLSQMNSHHKVIKLMYDLLLSGEGNSVIGSKNSMASNSYRKIFNSATNEVTENKGVDQWSVRSLSASDSSWGISRAVKTADGKFRSETHPKKFSSREAAAAAAKKLNSQKNESDMSGVMHAAKHLNKSFIITADVAEGGRKKYRVKAQSERVAQEKFAKHHSMAKIVDIKEE